ncbi:ParA family protein [Ottowia sp.]|uniref:ParA family protein n=1 Tax=Ottowia sp. TaxID=1898956 RepID=UPI002C31E980|nr:ParA family protein [Ottowia sp.]HRN76812.1 ParA family protein [Ottowia sp.]HRQ02631.1 ParA family protein [Ottowia sp.]
MPVVVIANPKGGVGKSTLATNVAGYWASQGRAVMLGDVDRQQSSRLWLSLRPPAVSPIASWDVQRDAIVRPPKGTTHVVLDTPAGLHGGRFKNVIRLADKVLVPVQPSIFDIYATREFIDQLVETKGAGKRDIGIVGMRVDERTIAADQLQQFVGGLGLPVLGMLRPTQNYVHLAARGLTVFDVAPGRVARDLEQWQGICRWLGH